MFYICKERPFPSIRVPGGNVTFAIGSGRLDPDEASARLGTSSRNIRAAVEGHPLFAEGVIVKREAAAPGPEVPTFPCDECEYVGKSARALAQHQRRMHPTE
jgi:hypothetical protein